MCNEYMLQTGKGPWHLSATHIPEMNSKKKIVYYTSKCWAKCFKSKTGYENDYFQLVLGLNSLLEIFSQTRL